MPPKKRTSNRRGGSTPRPEKNGDNSPLPNFSSPDATKPSLPAVPTKHSSAYGSSAVPVLPRQLASKPKMNLAEMAENIDEGIQAAQDRERGSSKEAAEDDEPQMNTRSKTRQRETSKEPSLADDESQAITRSKARSSAANGSTRRKKREPTPDQAQLLESLREVSESPEPPIRKNPSRRSRSTPIPQPPVAHDFSTGSPAAHASGTNLLQSGQLHYPSPLDRFGSTHARQQTLGSPQQRSSADNESTISFGVERDIHDDSLQRTHPGLHRKNPNGRNITAPPRRPSGLAFQEAIEEEDEHESHLASSPKHSIENSPQNNRQFDHQRQRDMASAPAQTILHRDVRRRMRSEERVGPWMDHMNRALSTQPEQHRQSQPPQPIPQHGESNHSPEWADILFDMFKSIVYLVAVVSLVLFIQSSVTGYPFGNYQTKFSPNVTEMDILNSLSTRVTTLDSQVSSLSREVKSMRSDVDTVAAAKPEFPPVKLVKEPPKINFLTAGMGALVDPGITSPTFKPQSGLGAWLWGPRSQAPAAAMTPWEDVGDCWCGARREDGTTRLGVDLGRDIVPEEVVVEHMPKESTINPGVAPKEMEFWARFKRVDEKPAAERTFWSYFFKQSSTEDSSTGENSRRSWGSSLSETMMDLCGRAYHKEPASAYSDNQELPGFYRVGKFIYDQNRPDNVQKFSLDVVLDDPAIRVDKVAFVVKSNWGSENTCLYRLKVHGHL